jgi:putative membrane protein
MFIEKAYAAKIKAAIHRAEAKTRAELVAVVALESDDYRYVMLGVATILGLAAPFPWSLGVLAGDAVWAHSASLVVFLAVLALGQIGAVRRLIVPRSLMRRRAARNARSQFFAQRVRMTRERAGILLFVSIFEHHVEIIADDNAAAVPDAVWAEAVTAFVAALKADGPTAGFLPLSISLRRRWRNVYQAIAPMPTSCRTA